MYLNVCSNGVMTRSDNVWTLDRKFKAFDDDTEAYSAEPMIFRYVATYIMSVNGAHFTIALKVPAFGSIFQGFVTQCVDGA